MSLQSLPLTTPLHGELQPPGDKSISHRAVLLGSLAQGITRISGWLDAADTRATLNACRALGAGVEETDGLIHVHGCGANGLRAPGSDLDLGNSGTGVRLMMGVLAGQNFSTRLSGDHSLSRRPMGRVIRPLMAMGARFEATDERLPVTVHGSPLKGIDYVSPVASAQVKSAVLLAGLQADGITRVTEPALSRDHSERMLADFGVTVERDGLQVSISGGSPLKACDLRVPADFSSAAFFLVAASINPGSEITLRHVGLNPTRRGLLDLLIAMGADIRVTETGSGAEPIADLYIKGAQLRGIDVPPELVVSAIDEFPVLMAAAAVAQGVTRIRGAGELRVKESDRIAVMCRGLETLGVRLSETKDGADIHGGSIGPGRVEADDDHRCAMSFAILASRASGPVVIDGAEMIATSYPRFRADFNHLGGRVEDAA